MTLAIILGIGIYVFSTLDSAQDELDSRTLASSKSGAHAFIGPELEKRTKTYRPHTAWRHA